MTGTWTRENVLAAVDAEFAPEVRAEVLGALDGYLGDTPAGRARVQLAILKVAKGDVGKVRTWSEHSATVDYRDVLYAAEHEGAQDQSS